MSKILFIYHSNICNRNCGANSYLYNIAQALHKKGFIIDLFIPKSFDSKWDTLEKDLINKVFKEENYIIPRINFILNKVINKFFKKIKSNNFDEKLNWIDKNDIRRFKEVIKNNKYDYVIFSYIYYSKLLDFLPSNTVKVYSVNDFISIQEMQHGNYKFGEVIDEEINAIKKFDKVMFISNDEMMFFLNFIDIIKTSWLPPYTKIKKLDNMKKDIDIFFIGSDNIHNINGINWFLENVYPFIKNKNYKIVIAGKICSKLKHSKCKDILFLDYIEDLDLLYSRVKVVISPLRSGTGIKIKIIEAMSYDIPVVCTSKSLVGFIEKTNNGCVVADSPEFFSFAIENILNDEIFRKNLSIQAQDQCRKYYNEEYTKTVIDSVFN